MKNQSLLSSPFKDAIFADQNTKNAKVLINANLEMEKNMLYLDDDQLKLHKQYSQKMEKTRKQFKQKILDMDKRKVYAGQDLNEAKR